MPSPNAIFTELVSTTFRKHSKDLKDNVSKHNALYRRMVEKGQTRKESGGLTIVEGLDYAANSTYQRYSGFDVLNVGASDVISAAEYPWRQIAIHVVASGLEMRINSGESKIINLVKSRMKNAMRTFKNNFSADMYSDGTLPNQINGLLNLVSDNGLGVVGGIDASAWPFWQNKVQSAAAPLQGGGAITPGISTMESLMLPLWLALTRGDDQPDLQALYMATLTLTRMAEGGLYDQVGGGFCRYSVDPYWMIPHFEKMLYDNGQLLAVSAQAAVATGEELFRRITTETADWIRRDMEAPAGGYYSTLDADSEGHEGRFYVWTPEEVRKLLEPRQYEVLSRRFGLDREANFEGKWHLHAFESMARVAEATGIPEDEAVTLLDAARTRLLDVRNRRVWPARDEKILVSWNGLAIAGMAAAARALDRRDYVESAARAVALVREHCWHQGRLLAVHKDGRSRFPAYLDDYACMAWGLLELVQAEWHGPWLAWAIELVEALLRHFEDRTTTSS